MASNTPVRGDDELLSTPMEIRQTPQPPRQSRDDLLAQLLSEVSALRDENAEFRTTVKKLKKPKSRRALFHGTSREIDPACSDAVRKVYRELLLNHQSDQENEEQVLAFNFGVK